MLSLCDYTPEGSNPSGDSAGISEDITNPGGSQQKSPP